MCCFSSAMHIFTGKLDKNIYIYLKDIIESLYISGLQHVSELFKSFNGNVLVLGEHWRSLWRKRDDLFDCSTWFPRRIHFQSIRKLVMKKHMTKTECGGKVECFKWMDSTGHKEMCACVCVYTCVFLGG